MWGGVYDPGGIWREGSQGSLAWAELALHNGRLAMTTRQGPAPAAHTNLTHRPSPLSTLSRPHSTHTPTPTHRTPIYSPIQRLAQSSKYHRKPAQ